MFEFSGNYNYQNGSFESDLACERRRADTDERGVEYKKETVGPFSWERIRISSAEGARSIGRPCGNYNTLTLGKMNLLDDAAIEDAANEIAIELCSMLERSCIAPERILIAGLGNAELTPDSVGPKTASLVNATMHIKNFDKKMFNSLECSEIAVCTPGVMAQSGMEASDIILGLCKRISPDAVFAIDALASRAPERLGSTIQISDTGIFPGSGIGNNRAPLNMSTLGIPVIAIGVPTVINAKMLFSDAESKNISSSIPDDMFVSPREIDTIVKSCSAIISSGINQAFGIL